MRRWWEYWRTVRSRVVLDRGFARALWVVPWLALRARRGPETARIAFAPQPAGPWYTLPLSLRRTGVRTVRRVEDADVVMAFDDRTDTGLPPQTSKPCLNARCNDISKTHVARVFGEVFGYALAVDPLNHAGPMVAKSNVNGVHDGRIVYGPLTRRQSGMAYQRLVDSTVRDGVTDELRATCVGGRTISIVRKEKAAAARFAAAYLRTHPVSPDDVLSAEERVGLARFLERMGLDFGSVDLLRDHAGDGRLYVVDVNKTCMPVLSMNVRDLHAELARVGAAAEALILARASRPE